MKNKIALDSNIFIYHFEQNPKYSIFTTKIFQKLESGSIHGVTSVMSVIETLSYPSPDNLIKEVQESFLTLPNLTIHDINWKIGLESSRIRRIYGFRLPDAIQLATGIVQNANSFITNDQRLKKCKEQKVILLEEFKT